LPVWELEPGFVLFVLALATSSVVPAEGGDGVSAPALGVSYTKPRQRRLGRLSMAAFACALLAEAMTGHGPLELLQLDTGVPVNEWEAGLLFLLLVLGFGDDVAEEDAEAQAPAPAGPARGELGASPDEPKFSWSSEGSGDSDEGEGDD